MADLGSAYVNIVPKAPGISKNIESVLNEGSPGAEKAGQSFGKRILAGLAGLGIGAAVGGMVKQAFDVGGALQQSFGGLETIYGDAAAAAKKYAQEASAAGISANSYAEQAVSFGAALKAAYGGDTAQAMEAANLAILDMTDNAAKMGTPLESIQSAYQGFAKQNYTMLDNLKLGYGGTRTEMERLLKDAQAITGVEYNIDNLGDVYSAIHVIQNELGLTGVAAEEAKSTLTGSAGAMKAAWENLMGSMTTGEGLETAMSGLAESVGNFGGNVLRMLGQLGKQLPALFTGLVTQVAPQIAPMAGELIGGLVDSLFTTAPTLLGSVGDVIEQVLDNVRRYAPQVAMRGLRLVKDLALGIINGAQDMAASGSSILSSFVDTILSSLPELLLVGGSVLQEILNGILQALPNVAQTALGLISSLTGSVTAYLPQIFETGGSVLQSIIDGVVMALPQLAETALTLVTSLAGAVSDNLPQILTQGAELLRSLTRGILDRLPDLLVTAGSLIAQIVAGLAGGLPDLLQSGVDLLGAVGEGILSAIVTLVRDLPQVWDAIKESCADIDWKQLGLDIIEGIKKGIKNAASSLGQALRRIIRGGLDEARDEAEVGSPSRLFARELGAWIPPGVAMGVEANMQPLDRAIDDMIDNASRAVSFSAARPIVAAPSNDADRIIAALQQLQLHADVSLEGDARSLFRVMRNENNTRTKATNYNALAAGV